jgi:hypothetical protein
MTYFLASYACSFSLPRSVGGKRTKRKGTFSKVFFEGFLSKPFKNRPSKAKFSPRFQKFLTLLMAYIGEKERPISKSAHNNLQHAPKHGRKLTAIIIIKK